MEDEWRRMLFNTWNDGKTLYFLTLYQEGEKGLPFNCSVVTADIQTGATARIKTPGAQGMCAYQEGKLLLLCTKKSGGSYQYALRTLDLSTGEISGLPVEMPSADKPLSGLAYDQGTDTIYYADQTALYAIKNGAPPVRVQPLNISYITETTAASFDANRYILQTEGGEGVLIIDPSASGDAENTLTISYQAGKKSNLIAALTKERPNLILDARIDALTAADVAQKIREGDKTDIFELPADSAFSAFIDKGYAAALDASQILSADAETLYPAVSRALKDASGQLSAYPSSFFTSLWSFNQKNFDAYFEGEAVPSTWKDFFTLMLRFEETSGPNDNVPFIADWDYESMVGTVMASYLMQRGEPDAPPDMQAPELKEALALLAKVRDALLRRGVVAQSEGEMYPYEEVMNHSIFYPYSGMILTSGIQSDFVDLLPFTFANGEAPKIQCNMNVYVLNPNAQNPALALRYLELNTLLSAEQDRYTLYYGIHQTAFSGYEKPNYEQKLADYREQEAELQKQIAALTGEKGKDSELQELNDQLTSVEWYLINEEYLRWYITPEAVARWQKMAPFFNCFERSPYVFTDTDATKAQTDALISRYASGQLPVDEFLKQMQNIMESIHMENM